METRSGFFLLVQTLSCVLILILFFWWYKNSLNGGWISGKGSCCPLMENIFVQSYQRLVMFDRMMKPGNCHWKTPLKATGADGREKKKQNKTGSDSWLGQHGCDSTEVALKWRVVGVDVLLLDSQLAFERIYLSTTGSQRASYTPNVRKLQLPWRRRLNGWSIRFRSHIFRPNVFSVLSTWRILLCISLCCDLKDWSDQSRNWRSCIIHPLKNKTD